MPPLNGGGERSNDLKGVVLAGVVLESMISSDHINNRGVWGRKDARISVLKTPKKLSFRMFKMGGSKR